MINGQPFKSNFWKQIFLSWKRFTIFSQRSGVNICYLYSVSERLLAAHQDEFSFTLLVSLHKKWSFLRIWWHLLKKSLMENFIFWAVYIESMENDVPLNIWLMIKNENSMKPRKIKEYLENVIFTWIIFRVDWILRFCNLLVISQKQV